MEWLSVSYPLGILGSNARHAGPGHRIAFGEMTANTRLSGVIEPGAALLSERP